MTVFFPVPFLSQFRLYEELESFTVLFIYLVGIGFAEVENWQQVWKVAKQFTVLSAS